MNSTTPTQPRTGDKTDRLVHDTRPLKFLLLIAGILTARWIWIAGVGDYGWTYELGMRVWRGEVPFRDYISTLPQMTSYTIVPFLVATKGDLWAFAVHLYLWWFAALLVGWRVAGAFGLRPAAQTAAMFLATCLSFPALHLGHAYSYAGTFFFGLTLLKLMKYRERPETKHLLVAGACAGLGLFAKQNLGAVSLLLGLTVLVFDGMVKNQTGALVGRTLLFFAGAAAAFLPIFGFFASKAGASEVFQQMFSDAGKGKGGLFGMIYHLLPFFFFTPETPLRGVWTLLISGAISASFLVTLGSKIHRTQKSPVRHAPPANAGMPGFGLSPRLASLRCSQSFRSLICRESEVF